MKKSHTLFSIILISAFCFSGCHSSADNTLVAILSQGADTTSSIARDMDFDYSGQIDYLIVVDSDHPLPDDWEDRIQLVETVNAVGDIVRTEKTAYNAYLQMKEALENKGVYVDMDSAFRSEAEQQEIIDEFTEKYGADYTNSYAAAPGTSEHHTGLAIDLFLIVDGRIVYENEDLMKYPAIWESIHEELPNYGFILSYPPENAASPYEPWHIRYVGMDAAKEIQRSGISLEEYRAEK